MGKFIITEEEKQQIKKLYGILFEQELSQYNDVEANIYQDDFDYVFKVSGGKLYQYVKDPTTNKKMWKELVNGDKNYDLGFDTIKKFKEEEDKTNQLRESGKKVMGCLRNGEPEEILIPSNLTTEDLQKVYDQTLDYYNKEQEFKRINGKNTSFCQGDIYDLNLTTVKPEVMEKCGISNYENILSVKVLDRKIKAGIIESIDCLVRRKDTECAKRIGITLK